MFKSVPSTTLKMEANLRLDQISFVCLGGIQVRPLDSLHRCEEQRCYLGEDTGQSTWRILVHPWDKMIFTRIKKGERADLMACLKKATSE